MHDVLSILDDAGKCGEELGRQKPADKAALFKFDKESVQNIFLIITSSIAHCYSSVSQK